MANFKKQKGISIIFIVIITSFIFAIALGINSISYQQAKMMSELGYSTVAFFAADAGAERQLYNLYKEETIQDSFAGDFAPSFLASYLTNVKCSNSALDCLGISIDPLCEANNFCVNSVGTYQGTKRAIELKY